MPISLPGISRRSLLAGSVAASAALSWGGACGAAQASPRNRNRLALIADCHIPAQRETQNGAVNMVANLTACVAGMLARENGASHALFNGDLAHIAGLTGDYELLVELTHPLREAGIALHFALGNHDHRENFYAAVPGETRQAADGHVSVVEGEHANWFALDTLDVTNAVSGLVPGQQLAWLDRELAARATVPALVLGHHNLDFQHYEPGQEPFGVRNSRELEAVLVKHRHVRGYLHGHKHEFNIEKRGDGLTIIGLPPSAYVFREGAPSGWLDAEVSADGLSLVLNCLDQGHEMHGKTFSLAWQV